MAAINIDLRDDLGPVLRHVKQQVKALHPAYFAMSMATGIVSLACHFLGLAGFAALLFWINVAAYGALWVLTVARASFFRRSFFLDWSSHQRAPGFFTSVAATSVLGMQFLLLRGDSATAFGLWWLALLLWAVCTYAVFVALSIRDDKPSLGEGINGGWLVAVVATQAVCVLGCNVLPERLGNQDAILFFLASFWLCGGMLYIWMISLIFYRYTFFKFSPTDLMPPYWINMGAVAISTLAGTTLIAVTGDSPLLTSIRPFVKGFTLMYWATATWWIPMLLILGVWRHCVRRIELAYDPLYWGLVFPLGMYSLCTYQVSGVFELPFLLWLARAFVVLGLVAWLLTFFGLTSRFLYVLMLAARSCTRTLRALERTRSLPALEPSGARRSHAGGPS